MKTENEIEFIPLDHDGQELPGHSGFLTEFLLRLFRDDDTGPGFPPTPSSGEEVEEDVIEY